MMSLLREGENAITLAKLANTPYVVGKGLVELGADSVQLKLPKNAGQSYCDAQLDDYHLTGAMRWRPPVRMTLRARFSHRHDVLHGTAGFGFWNDPLGMTGIARGKLRLPRLRFPQAVWYFFASPPTNMPLALDVPGNGWKAATIDAGSLIAKSMLPVAPLGMLLSRWRWSYRLLWPAAQRILKIQECVLPVAMDVWHEYELTWRRKGALFVVDGQEILHTAVAPRGPLGFVTWVDNQYMVATPQGTFRNATCASGEQFLEIAALEVVPLSES